MNLVELELDETLADFEIQDWIDNVFSVQYPDVKARIKKGCSGHCHKKDEWHYPSKGELPTKKLEEKQLLVRIRNYTEGCIFAYYMLDKYYSKHGKRFYSDIDCDYPIDTEDVIAWKELIPPAEVE